MNHRWLVRQLIARKALIRAWPRSFLLSAPLVTSVTPPRRTVPIATHASSTFNTPVCNQKSTSLQLPQRATRQLQFARQRLSHRRCFVELQHLTRFRCRCEPQMYRALLFSPYRRSAQLQYLKQYTLTQSIFQWTHHLTISCCSLLAIRENAVAKRNDTMGKSQITYPGPNAPRALSPSSSNFDVAPKLQTAFDSSCLRCLSKRLWKNDYTPIFACPSSTATKLDRHFKRKSQFKFFEWSAKETRTRTVIKCNLAV